MLLGDEVVLVSGANRGIGWATCQLLAANGALVWAGSRSVTDELRDRLDALNAQSPGNVRPVTLDITDEASVRCAFAAIKNSESPLTGLVNNAGITHNAVLQMTKVEDARQLLETNSISTMRLMHAAVRQMMRRKRGAIVNVSSTASFDANSGRVSYGASKAAVNVLTRGAAREWAAYGIRVNAVAPGVTRTEMLESMSADVLARVEATTDLGRTAEPEEIAQAICFLLSPMASYVSGQVLRVDGGMWT